MSRKRREIRQAIFDKYEVCEIVLSRREVLTLLGHLINYMEGVAIDEEVIVLQLLPTSSKVPSALYNYLRVKRLATVVNVQTTEVSNYVPSVDPDEELRKVREFMNSMI